LKPHVTNLLGWILQAIAVQQQQQKQQQQQQTSTIIAHDI